MYKLYNDDCIKIMNGINDNSIDCIITDPPYRVIQHGTSGMGGIFKSHITDEEKELNGKLFKHNDIDVSDYASEFYRILKEGTHCYVMTNNFNLQSFLNEFTRVGFVFTKLLVWDKMNKICNQYYMDEVEYILFLRKGHARKINNCGDSNLFVIPNKKMKSEDGKPLHPTEKPIELMEKFVLNSTNEGDIVLDPFLGIGGTGVACVKNNRNFIGCELDSKYFEIAKNRIENNGNYINKNLKKDNIFDM